MRAISKGLISMPESDPLDSLAVTKQFDLLLTGCRRIAAFEVVDWVHFIADQVAAEESCFDVI